MLKRAKDHGQLLAMLFTAGLAVGCSAQFKVREDWSSRFNRPIPLNEVSVTWEQIRDGQIPPSEDLDKYNQAVCSSVVQVARNWSSESGSLATVNTESGPIELDVESVNVRDVELIDRVVPAEFVKVRRGFESTTEIDGVGCSLLVRQQQTQEDPMIPEMGLWYPATAILNLDDRQEPVLELFDPTRDGHLPYGRGRLPLDVNYTAVFARDFQDREGQFAELSALLKFDKYASKLGLYRVSAFDPEKEVCVLVHGIYSSPMTWDEAINEFYASEALRERYEFWVFGYPTGAPIPYMASKFRESLVAMQSFRSANGATERNITLVGHSMGGLLSKAVTLSGGDREWNSLFKVPIDELNVSAEDREILREMIYYEPLPFVDRVVFCATPHRGSQLADKAVFRFIGGIVQLPSQLTRLTEDIVQQSSYALTPIGREIAEERRSSVDQLRSTSRATAEFLDKPLNPDVRYFSIIGCKKPEHKVDLEKSSDGVVPYSSAHIEGVESEFIVENSPHGVHKEQEGIEELVRILNIP